MIDSKTLATHSNKEIVHKSFCHITSCQGCGLGLDVSVSRRTNVSSRSRLEKNCQRLSLVSVSANYVSCPRPIFDQIVQATLIKLTQCEQVLDAGG